jgi:CMP/dCMP kinase
VSPELNLRHLLGRLARADAEFVVIGSSALAIQGWEISPEDLDLFTVPDSVDVLIAALGVGRCGGAWVREGTARRFECDTADGPVDIYIEVSGQLNFEEVQRKAVSVSIGEAALSVRAGSSEHVRDMRAAVGRRALPDDAVVPGERRGKPMVIAIDGPAGAGKSTVARTVAKRIGFTYLDTGAMYRCVTLAVLERRADTDNPELIGEIAASIEISLEGDRVFLNGQEVSTAIRTGRITAATPHLAAYPEVREAMVRRQRQLFSSGSYVAEGRDIATVVAPDAPLKIYLTASPEERAKRRSRETGQPVLVVLTDLEERDRLDSARELSALKAAEDAVLVDTTGRSIDDVVEEIVSLAGDRGIV